MRSPGTMSPLSGGMPGFHSATNRLPHQQLYFGQVGHGLIPQASAYGFQHQPLSGLQAGVPSNFVMPFQFQRQTQPPGQRVGARRSGNLQQQVCQFFFLTPAIEEENRSDYLARVFGCNEGKNLNQLFFAPYKENRHWMLAAISPWNGLVCWLDPIGAGSIPEFAKTVINEGIIKFSILHLKDVRKIKKNPKIGWMQPHCPRQPQNSKDSGYYVCRYMLEILNKGVLWISDQFFPQEAYSSEKVDEIRDVWVEYLLKQANEADEEIKDDGMEIA